jgi:hypothetical protein
MGRHNGEFSRRLFRHPRNRRLRRTLPPIRRLRRLGRTLPHAGQRSNQARRGTAAEAVSSSGVSPRRVRPCRPEYNPMRALVTVEMMPFHFTQPELFPPGLALDCTISRLPTELKHWKRAAPCLFQPMYARARGTRPGKWALLFAQSSAAADT